MACNADEMGRDRVGRRPDPVPTSVHGILPERVLKCKGQKDSSLCLPVCWKAWRSLLAAMVIRRTSSTDIMVLPSAPGCTRYSVQIIRRATGAFHPKTLDRCWNAFFPWRLSLHETSRATSTTVIQQAGQWVNKDTRSTGSTTYNTQ